MAIERQRLTPDERANLVAYLDHELNDAEARAISTKLTQSPTARRELEALQKTWELLDHLPRPHASEAFTEKTLVEARRLDDVEGRFGRALSSNARRLLRGAAWVAAAALAFLVGYASIRWGVPDPSSRLARDLSLAEHLDEYRDVGSFPFLRDLYNSPEFGPGRPE